MSRAAANRAMKSSWNAYRGASCEDQLGAFAQPADRAAREADAGAGSPAPAPFQFRRTSQDRAPPVAIPTAVPSDKVTRPDGTAFHCEAGRDSAPLCPAGHLPLRWGDSPAEPSAEITDIVLSDTVMLILRLIEAEKGISRAEAISQGICALADRIGIAALVPHLSRPELLTRDGGP